MDSRSDMAVFVTVMTEGSFAAAARELQMTPSGVSRRISTLEERLGVRLLNRTTRRLSLTEPGELYYHRAAQIVSDINNQIWRLMNHLFIGDNYTVNFLLFRTPKSRNS